MSARYPTHPCPAPHAPMTGSEVAVACRSGRPIPPEALSRLEHLDDVFFGAIAGDADALDQTGRLWREARAELCEPLLDESREQYLRRAEVVCAAGRAAPIENLAATFAALEVLTLLAD
ncbi:hypothetical protein Pla175_00990 [Pirellulimonas nuda]|uniref:Uncharacterized protein n=1 Tax=Pirellulimonas nuda TaxID=2528009 RepID=A0A518D5K9_9BACT|nr:hypothetical protein [Pirellulimonas nuda]QDU86749.1 hypothetical protein Pla175_00990 [Pirellulimonas nuda]